MTIIEARRIVHYCEDMHMSYERLASTLGCSVPAARSAYSVARSMVDTADARSAIAKLNEIANRFNTTTDNLITMYA